MKLLEKELGDETVKWERKRMVILLGSYLMLCFGGSLRGNEGFYLEGSQLLDMIKLGTTEEDKRNETVLTKDRCEGH